MCLSVPPCHASIFLFFVLNILVGEWHVRNTYFVAKQNKRRAYNIRVSRGVFCLISTTFIPYKKLD